jgi:predicted anti-sigma-YlaC factor YlaD
MELISRECRLPGMTLRCDDARLALSARLDGEPFDVPAGLLDSHLAGCAGCADWLGRAEQVTRLVRVQPARVPDLTGQILQAVAADRYRAPAARPARRFQIPRGQALTRLLQAAVAAFAAMELSLALPVMFGFSEDQHATHEMGAFAATVAVAFLIAAFQPRLARAYTPVAVVLALCLTMTSGMDVGEHRVTIVHELGGHFGTIIQAAMIWLLGRLHAPAKAAAPARMPAGVAN